MEIVAEWLALASALALGYPAYRVSVDMAALSKLVQAFKALEASRRVEAEHNAIPPEPVSPTPVSPAPVVSAPVARTAGPGAVIATAQKTALEYNDMEAIWTRKHHWSLVLGFFLLFLATGLKLLALYAKP
jgi:hypothetical protein